MRSFVLIIFAVFSLIIYSGCTINSGGDVEVSHKRLVDKIKPNHSKKRDIVRWFGDTGSKSYIDRKEKWTYSFFKEKRGLFAKDEVENYYLTIYFDPRTEKVLEYNFYNGDGQHIY